MFDEDREWEDLGVDEVDAESQESELWGRCQCRYCECLNRTDGGVCEDCRFGAHQG